MMSSTRSKRAMIIGIAAAVLAVPLAIGGVVIASTSGSANSGGSDHSFIPGDGDPEVLPSPTETPPHEPNPDKELAKIEADGGYRVSVSPLSDVLLVAEEGAAPIPVDERSWGGNQDPQLRNLATDLMEVSQAYPQNLAEGSFSSGDSFVEIYAKDPEGAGIPEIIAIIKEREMARKVVVVSVAHSMSELTKAQSAILAAWEDDLAVNIDFVENTIVVIPFSPEAEEKLLRGTDSGKISVAELIAAAPAGSTAEADIAELTASIEPPMTDQGAG